MRHCVIDGHALLEDADLHISTICLELEQFLLIRDASFNTWLSVACRDRQTELINLALFCLSFQNCVHLFHGSVSFIQI